MKKVIFLMILASSLLIGQSTQELMKMAKKAGINTEAQARSLAKQRGMTDAQIEEELIKRGLTIKDDQVADTLENIIQGVIQDGPVVEEGFETLIDTVTEGQLAAQPLQYFGYDIFQGDPGVFQSSTFGAVDPDYNIGPGDEVIIMLWGETQFRQVFTVNREGFIFLPEVGQVFVNSITLGELERKLFRLLSKVYSSINPSSGKASTFMDVSLGNLRPLRIIVLGEVSQPGAYSVSTSTSLFTALYYFRGPTTLGSLRDIRLIRDGKQVASVDFYDYLLSGKQLNDVRLQLDDVIFIPPRGKTVTIRGAVKRNAIFELKEKESIKDLVEMAGGLEMTAYLERAQVDRVVPFEERTDEWKDRVISDFNIGDEITGETLMQLEDADNIQVFSILDIHQNTVYLSGSSVVRPGRYELKNGMRIRELVEKAGGLLNDAYLGAAHLVRTREENLQKQLISFHLDGAMEGDSVNNLELQWNDSLIIYNENTITNAFKTVSINGSVKTPGEYSFFPGMNLGDLFLDAGGFPLNVMRAKVEIASIDPMNLNPKLYSKTRQILFNREGGQTEFFSMDDLLNKINILDKVTLQPFDVVSVRRDPGFEYHKSITVNGAVWYPGTYSIQRPGETVSDILQRAGGLRSEAYPMASTLNRQGQIIRLSFEEIIDNPHSKENFEIFDKDTLTISEKSNLVFIAGEVNTPGVYKYYPNLSMNGYLNLAGGITTKAELKEVWITYPDGTSEQRRWLKNPRVYDGSIIVVGRKEESEPLDKTEFAKEMTSIFANFAQVVSIIYLATK